MKTEYNRILDEMINEDLLNEVDGRQLLQNFRYHNIISYDEERVLKELGPRNSTKILVSFVLKLKDDINMIHLLDSLEKENFKDAHRWLRQKLDNYYSSSSTRSVTDTTDNAAIENGNRTSSYSRRRSSAMATRSTDNNWSNWLNGANEVTITTIASPTTTVASLAGTIASQMAPVAGLTTANASPTTTPATIINRDQNGTRTNVTTTVTTATAANKNATGAMASRNFETDMDNEKIDQLDQIFRQNKMNLKQYISSLRFTQILNYDDVENINFKLSEEEQLHEMVLILAGKSADTVRRLTRHANENGYTELAKDFEKEGFLI